MSSVYREPEPKPSAVAVGLSVADEARRVQEASESLGGLGADPTLDDLRDALQGALHRSSALGMATAQAALSLSDDQEQRHREYLRIEARLMRIENQIRRMQGKRAGRSWGYIVLVLLAFLVGAYLF